MRHRRWLVGTIRSSARVAVCRGPSPGEVFVNAGPVQAEGDGPGEFFERHAEQHDAGERGEVPHPFDIAGCGPFESEQEHGVVAEEQQAADPGFGFEVGAADDSDGADRHGDDARIDRIPWEEVKDLKNDEWRGEGLIVVPVQRLAFFVRRHGTCATTGERGVEHGGHAADAEGEDQAFEIETGALCEVEEAWRIPVFGHKERFSQPERRGERAGPYHGLTMYGEGEIEYGPRYEKGGCPSEPYVLFIDHAVKVSTRLPAVQRGKERR